MNFQSEVPNEPPTSPIVILLNWNCAEDTIRCARAVLASPLSLPLLIVDNASDDRIEVSTIEAALTGVTVIQAITNLGYAGGMNLGMRWSIDHGFTHALLLNPDTYPTEEVLISFFELAGQADVVGIAQASMGQDQEEVRYQSAATMKGNKAVAVEYSAQGPVEVDIVTGAAMLINLKAAKTLNFMDERFFHYKEEFDLCFRLRAHGGRVLYIASPILVHRRGGSLAIQSPKALYYIVRNELIFSRKQGRIAAVRRFPSLLLYIVRRSAQERTPRHVAAGILGFSDGCASRGGPCARRYLIHSD